MFDFNRNIAQQLLNDETEFPVDFDLAWRWLNYSRKDSAKRTLIENFIEGIDFHISVELPTVRVPRPKQIILLTIECFKSLAMMAGTEKGKQVRKYFLECEKIAKEKAQRKLPQNYIEALEALIVAEKQRLALEAQVAEQDALLVEWHPLVNNYRQFIDTSGLISMAEAAKMLPNTGRNRLIRLLRLMDIFMPNKCEPYQRYMKHFKVKAKVRDHAEPDGSYKSDIIALFTPKGFNSIVKTMIKKAGGEDEFKQYLNNPALLEVIINNNKQQAENVKAHVHSAILRVVDPIDEAIQ